MENILCILIANEKSAIPNLYVDTISAFSTHSHMVVIYPHVYKRKELPVDLLYAEPEKILADREQRNKMEQLKRYRDYAEHLVQLVEQYDVKHIYFEVGLPVFQLILMSKLSGVSYTMRIHDPVLHEGESFRSHLSRWLEKMFVFPRIHNFITSYQESLVEMKENGGLSDLVPRTHVLYLPQMRCMEFSDIRATPYPIKWDFIFFGRIELYKGLDVLLDVMREQEMRKVRLLIIGRGSEAKLVASQALDLPNVTYIQSYVPDRELAMYIMQSRFVVLPYRSATGSQTVAIANYYQRMVLATSVGCFSEYIVDGRNGILMPKLDKFILKQAMLKMMSLKEEKYREGVVAEYKKFNIFKLAAKLEQVIREGYTVQADKADWYQN